MSPQHEFSYSKVILAVTLLYLVSHILHLGFCFVNFKIYALKTYYSYQVEDASVTALSWNCTGSVLAVAYQALNNNIIIKFLFFIFLFYFHFDMLRYGRYDHTGWCVHSGLLCAWSVFRRNMNPTQPDLELDTGLFIFLFLFFLLFYS